MTLPEPVVLITMAHDTSWPVHDPQGCRVMKRRAAICTVCAGTGEIVDRPNDPAGHHDPCPWCEAAGMLIEQYDGDRDEWDAIAPADKSTLRLAGFDPHDVYARLHPAPARRPAPDLAPEAPLPF